MTKETQDIIVNQIIGEITIEELIKLINNAVK